jgi:hypothetical protein
MADCAWAATGTAGSYGRLGRERSFLYDSRSVTAVLKEFGAGTKARHALVACSDDLFKGTLN